MAFYDHFFRLCLLCILLRIFCSAGERGLFTAGTKNFLRNSSMVSSSPALRERSSSTKVLRSAMVASCSRIRAACCLIMDFNNSVCSASCTVFCLLSVLSLYYTGKAVLLQVVLRQESGDFDGCRSCLPKQNTGSFLSFMETSSTTGVVSKIHPFYPQKCGQDRSQQTDIFSFLHYAQKSKIPVFGMAECLRLVYGQPLHEPAQLLP